MVRGDPLGHPRLPRLGRPVGTYICADLACSLYLRGLRRSVGGGRMPETLDQDARIHRLGENVEDFLARVVDSDAPRLA